MDFITGIMDFIIHIDDHLVEIVSNYGMGTYLILFLIVFSETGLVVAPFLPGDSLLFVVGALGAKGALDAKLAAFLLILAAIAGDTLNYHIGKLFGNKAFKLKGGRFFKKEHLEKTHAFYEKHGGKTIIIARFIPIVRTFAPFVAGMGSMTYWKFISYNVVGAIVWVILFVTSGYFFGNMPIIKNNFKLIVIGIILISVLPAIIALIKGRLSRGTIKET